MNAYVKPERDTLWRHPMYRDRWRVKSAGPKWVTLACVFPLHLYMNTVRVHADDWPAGWRREPLAELALLRPRTRTTPPALRLTGLIGELFSLSSAVS